MSAPPLETNSGGLAKDMTLRDWFAGQCLIGMISAKCVEGLEYSETAIAEDAYLIADALLIERERGE